VGSHGRSPEKVMAAFKNQGCSMLGLGPFALSLSKGEQPWFEIKGDFIWKNLCGYGC
jgi:hypothetical protein